MPHMPMSACCPEKLYTEYARPRFSRTSWNSREDMPPPNAAFSTPSANRRSSVLASASQPSTRLACSMLREISVVPTPAGCPRWSPASRGSTGSAARSSTEPNACLTSSTTVSWSRLPAAATTKCSGVYLAS